MPPIYRRLQREALRMVSETPWPEAEQFCYDEHWKPPTTKSWRYLSLEVNNAIETGQK
jgi:hypothetical protein